MRLVGKSTFERDVRQRSARGRHQRLTPRNAAPHDETMRRLVLTDSKRPTKMPGAESGEEGEILQADRGIEVAFNVFHHLFYFPCRQSSARG